MRAVLALALLLLLVCGAESSQRGWLKVLRGGSVATEQQQQQQQQAPVDNAESLLQRFSAAVSSEEVFDLAELIPSIRRNTDKAMRIVLANHTDAVLAAHAIQRLANVTMLSGVQLSQDRRIEQLIETIEITASQLSILDLSRYCWGLSVLKIGDEEQVQLIFDEYCRRATEASTDELATMMWTVGCIKESFDDCGKNATLVSQLSTALLDKGSEAFERLNIKILIRVLWTLSVYERDAPLPAIHLGNKVLAALEPRFSELTVSNVVSVLSSVAKLSPREPQYNLTRTLLQRVAQELLEGRAASMDFPLAAEALAALYQHFSGPQGAPGPAASLRDLVETTASALINATASLSLATLPVGSVASLIRLAVLVDSVDDRRILVAGLSQIEAQLATKNSVSAHDAASLLESVAMLTWTVRRERGFHHESALPSAENSSSSSSSPSVAGLGTFLALQRLAGRMSSVCSLNSPRLRRTAERSSGSLLSASWATASFSRPCLTLLCALKDDILQHTSSEEKDAQQSFDSWVDKTGPSNLGKLAVVLASERLLALSSSSSVSAGAASVLDADLVAELLSRATAALALIAPAGLQVQACISLAELTQRSSSPPASAPSPLQSVNISAHELSRLRTTSVLKFLWSAGRLPEGLVSNDTVAEASRVLESREIDVGYSLGRYSSGAVQATEFMLLSRLLFDARKPNGRLDTTFIDAVVANIKKALLAHLPRDEREDAKEEQKKDEGERDSDLSSRGRSSNSKDDDKNLKRQRQKQGSSSADLVALGEILRALLEFKVFNADLAALVERCARCELDFHCQHSGDDSSSASRRLYDLGRLEGLLQAYCGALGPEAKKTRRWL